MLLFVASFDGRMDVSNCCLDSNSKGHPKDADATPSNQISASQVTLSKMSTKISTLSAHQDVTNSRVDTLDNDTRPLIDGCSGHGERSDCHLHNANRGIARGVTSV